MRNIRPGDRIRVSTTRADWWPRAYGGDVWEVRPVTVESVAGMVRRDQYGMYVEYVAPSNNGMLWGCTANTVCGDVIEVLS